MKICTKCQCELPETEFFVKDSKTGRLHTQCKSCYKQGREKTYRQHYQNNKDQYKARARKRNVRVNSENTEKLISYLQEHPCVDCGEKDIVVLEFDHRDRSQKSTEISIMVRQSYSWSRIEEEIAKCDVVCANCHRRRTAKQFGWRKLV